MKSESAMGQSVKIGVRGYTIWCQICSYLQFPLLCGWSLPAISTFIRLFRNFTVFTNDLMILPRFYLISRSFYINPYMDLRPRGAILIQKEIYCIPIG